MMKGFRVVGILAMAFAVAHCGDSDVRVTTGPGVVPAPGTFTGTLSDGGSIRLEVGSIEEVAFDCDGVPIQETFTPPKQIDSDGTFDLKFSDGGRKFRIVGTFRDGNDVDGTIDDEDNQCDVSYDATRGGVVTTATPARTPTGIAPTPTGNAATSTPNEEPTSTPGGPTETPGPGATLTPGGGPTQTSGPGATKTATPAPSGSPCPVAVEVVGTAGSQKVLDTGWTGLAHNQTVISDGKLTFTVSGCDSPVRPCGTCDVSGPIQNLKADQGDINAHRCSNDTSIKCDNDGGCTSPGKCAFFFGAPLPLSAGGVSTCVTNQVNGTVTGTVNVESGAFASALNLSSRVFNAIELAQPCPTCSDTTLNDGTKGGTCSGGPKNGQPCDSNGSSAVPSFGKTSFDCPPNPGAVITTLSISLDGSSGTETMALTASSPPCSAAAGKKCFCPSDGQVTQPNACLDDTATPSVDESQCAADSQTEGHCAAGPIDPLCRIETFRGCLGDSDCPAAGDSCITQNRPCYLDNGAVGGSVKAIGMADPPDNNGESDPTFAALFCVGKTNAAVNAAAGLPGLGRIELPIHSKEILTLP
jgi:hypothetical protein